MYTAPPTLDLVCCKEREIVLQTGKYKNVRLPWVLGHFVVVVVVCTLKSGKQFTDISRKDLQIQN